jgi:hypothetical protein
MLDARWQALAEEFGAPVALLESARDLERVLAPLEAALAAAPALRVATEAFRRVGLDLDAADALRRDPARLDDAERDLAGAVEAARLAAAGAEVERLRRLFPPASGRFGGFARNLLGEGVAAPSWTAPKWLGSGMRSASGSPTSTRTATASPSSARRPSGSPPPARRIGRSVSGPKPRRAATIP